jgi:hypothetical protein
MAIRRNTKWDSTFKAVAALLSGGAALVSILSFVASHRESQDSARMAGLAAAEVSRIDLSPAADTAYAIGDTLHITTMAADAHGQALHAATVHWSVDDPSIAEVDSTGQVVARGAGVTSVTVAIGGRAGRARIWVLPRTTALAIEGDSTMRVAEGAGLALVAAASDARGNRIPPKGLRWASADAAVATIDSTGTLRGVIPGSTTITVAGAGLAAERRVEVIPVPASMTLTSGADQRGAAGQRLLDPVSVQVVSRSGRPVPGVMVRFGTVPATGVLDPDSAMTDARGVATTRWTLAPQPGRQRLTALVAGIDSAMAVGAEADPTARSTRIVLLTDSLAGEVGRALDGPVAIQVTDTSGLALADLPVSWTALDGGAFSLADSRTDSLGEAHAHWRLGPKSGRQRARVQVGNPRTLPPVPLSARASAGEATSIVVLSGDAQRGAVGSALAHPVVFRTTDSLGNGVSGLSLHLRAQTGVVDSAVETGADGKASVRWTLGNAAGPVRLVARVASRVDSAVVTATALPGAAKTLYFSSAPASGVAGRALSKPVQVIVRDRFGNPIPKVTVGFAVPAGKVLPAQAVTDASGRAATSWTLGPKRGKQALTATVKSPALKATQTVEAGAAPRK